MKKIFLLCFIFLIVPLTFIVTGETAKAITGAGTKEDPYLIRTADDLRAVTADLTGYYVQMNDIDLNHEEFPMIAANDTSGFQGTYDGQNYKIENLKIYKDASFVGAIGLFSRCSKAEIKNIKVINPELEHNYNGSGPIIGGIVGNAKNSSISNCSVTGKGYIKNNDTGGGIVADLTSSTITNCHVSVPIMDNLYSGGIVGICRGACTIQNCYSTNDLTSRAISFSIAGGIVGDFKGTSLTISKCYSTGALTANHSTGGIIGNGASGTNGTIKVENCYSISNIKTDQINNNSAKAGGLIGEVIACKLINSYFAGTLDGKKNYGLSERGTVTNSYFDGQKNNNVVSYINSKNTSSMLKQGTYTDWDFDDIWAITQDSTYPYLKDLPVPDGITVIPKDVDVDSITVTPLSQHMELYDVLNISYEILPKNATDSSVTFSTSDSSVAVINKNNQVVAIGNGSAVITLTTSNGKSAVCNITVGTGVKDIEVEEIRLSPCLKVMNINDTFQLSVNFTPVNVTNKTIQWTSTNTDVLTVNQDGKVTAKNVGFASIVALTKSGHRLAFCNLLVKGTSENLALNATASASSYFTYQNPSPQSIYDASKGNDGDADTYWWLSNYNSGDMYYSLTFPKKVLFNTIKIKEHGTEIKDYKLQIWDEDQWIDIKSGTGIGNDYSDKLETYCTEKIRILILSKVSDEKNELPAISEFEVYHELQ